MCFAFSKKASKNCRKFGSEVIPMTAYLHTRELSRWVCVYFFSEKNDLNKRLVQSKDYSLAFFGKRRSKKMT